MRSGDPDRLDVDELADAVLRQLAPVARALDAAERQPRVGLDQAVDEHRAGLDLARPAARRGRDPASTARRRDRRTSRWPGGWRRPRPARGSPRRPGRRSPRRRPACPCPPRSAAWADRRRPGPAGISPPSRRRAPRLIDSSTWRCSSSRRSTRACGPTCVPRSSGSPIVRARSSSANRAVNASATASTTMKRLAAMQLWPLLIRRASAAARAAVATSASARTMNGSLPPSSSTVFFSSRPARSATWIPACSLPVSVTATMRGSAMSAAHRARADQQGGEQPGREAGVAEDLLDLRARSAGRWRRA